MILLLYVDDMLIVGPAQTKIGNLKKTLNQTFSMKDLCPVRHILGITHSLRPDEEAVAVVTGEVCDKGASEIQVDGY